MPATHAIFVYGTLKRGFCRAHFLTGQLFLGDSRTLPQYRMFNCGTYPGLRPAPNDGLAIVGELWAVDSECLARLDREEGVAEGLYARQRIELDEPLPANPIPARVEAYFYLPSVLGFPDCGECWASNAFDSFRTP